MFLSSKEATFVSTFFLWNERRHEKRVTDEWRTFVRCLNRIVEKIDRREKRETRQRVADGMLCWIEFFPQHWNVCACWRQKIHDHFDKPFQVCVCVICLFHIKNRKMHANFLAENIIVICVFYILLSGLRKKWTINSLVDLFIKMKWSL